MKPRFEFTEQTRLPTQLSNLTTRNDEPIYQALQVAYLHDGGKYPTPFNYRLYQGPDKNKADAANPIPVGFYTLKDSAVGISYQNLNCDFSQIEPLQQQQKQTAA
tara:strand:+ start:2090 stop:2404 length:315 start_codon:yes stop_codon:yes gene_type:complete